MLHRRVEQQRSATVERAPARRHEPVPRTSLHRAQVLAGTDDDVMPAPGGWAPRPRPVDGPRAVDVDRHPLTEVRKAQRPQRGDEPERADLHAQEPQSLPTVGTRYVGAEVRLGKGAWAGDPWQ